MRLIASHGADAAAQVVHLQAGQASHGGVRHVDADHAEGTFRLAAIERAAASGADVALISRGGYGLTRILPGINYQAVAKAVEQGTHFVGLSDFTAFQNALLAQTGAVSWAGPALIADFGKKDEVDDIMLDCFEDLLYGHGEGAGWRMPKQPEGAVPDDFYVEGALLHKSLLFKR